MFLGERNLTELVSNTSTTSLKVLYRVRNVIDMLKSKLEQVMIKIKRPNFVTFPIRTPKKILRPTAQGFYKYRYNIVRNRPPLGLTLDPPLYTIYSSYILYSYIVYICIG